MAITNGIPLINGIEYSWGDIVATIGGVPVTGITAIEYGEDQDVVNVYGAGRYPISRSKGRITPTAKITLKMGEVAAIQLNAPNGRIQDIAPFDIGVSYLPESGVIVHDTIKACQFKQNQRSWKEGDTTQDVELELIVARIKWNGALV
jgi:hypothetical protein